MSGINSGSSAIILSIAFRTEIDCDILLVFKVSANF